MQIIGFNLTKISAERKEKLEGKLEIKQNIGIDDISKEKIPISENEILKIKFNFGMDYSPDFAKLEFEGEVLLLPDKEEMKNFLKSWKKKQVPEQARVLLFNFIINKCNMKALNLEDELNIPLHVQMPRINPNQQLDK